MPGILAFVAGLFALAQLNAVGVGAVADVEREDARIMRRVPSLIPGAGQVDFPITCGQPLTQLHFNQGVAWLHAGEPRQADTSFYHAAWIEPGCPMAWCGLALANADNRPLAAYYAQQAARHGELASDFEERLIAAVGDYVEEGRSENDRRVNFSKALDQIASAHPANPEAAALLVRQFLDNRAAGIPIPYTAAVDALIGDVLRKRPEHPIHYARMLLWEVDQPRRALESALVAEQALPDAPMVLAAAGRIHARLGQDERAVTCYEAATDAARRRMRDQRLCPGEVGGLVELLEPLATQLASVGRFDEACSLARQLIEFPCCRPDGSTTEATTPTSVRHGTTPPARREPPNPTTTGQRLLLELLVQRRSWNDLRQLATDHYFDSLDPEIELRRTRALGLACAAEGDEQGLAAQLLVLRQLERRPTATRGQEATQWKLNQLARTYLDELAEAGSAAGPGANPSPTYPAAPALRGERTIFEFRPAPSLDLPDRHGGTISLADLAGKPVILVFYLGAGCPHCIEQLRSFTPLCAEFDEAGISVIAVSTDSVAGLQETFRVAGAEDAVPFRLASDAQLRAFQEFGAFDPREKKPLHGTFLVDPRGRILWQQVGREPFMATRQLLTETRRVLALGNGDVSK